MGDGNGEEEYGRWGEHGGKVEGVGVDVGRQVMNHFVDCDRKVSSVVIK